MAKKNNRNIRLSDEIVEMIERQEGQNFTQKFENLVTRCMWELPAKEKEIKRLDKEIAKSQNQLRELGVMYTSLSRTLKVASESADSIALILRAQSNKL